jgi:DNA-binding transcriptional MerR regulator
MYSTHAFAELTGVTVKALRHYERVGLLAPKRTRAQYRRYALGDLQRIERILALKSLGLSLMAIKALLKRGPVGLRAHRAALEDKRARLDRAIAALDEIQHDTKLRAALRRFMADAAWERWEARRTRAAVDRPPDRAPASAIALFHDIAAALDNLRPPGRGRRLLAGTEVTGGDGGRGLLARSRDVIAPETRDAWSRRAGWPSGLRRYVASCYEMEPDVWERVVAFIEAHGTR